MGAREFAEWVAYCQIEGPIGPERDDLRAAIGAWVTAMVNKGKRGRKPRIMDFMPKFGKGSVRGASQSVDQD